MSQQDCQCRSEVDTPIGGQSASGWIGDTSVQTAPLPRPVAHEMERFLTTEVDHFGDVLQGVRSAVGTNGLAVEDLCHVEDSSDHTAETGTETFNFRCFYDGIVLATLVDSPVEVHTVTPGNKEVHLATRDGSELAVEPSDAVMSFGVASDQPVPADEVPGPRDAYEAICPYVKAFEDRAAYERWAETAPAATVGLPMDRALPIAEVLTAGMD